MIKILISLFVITFSFSQREVERSRRDLSALGINHPNHSFRDETELNEYIETIMQNYYVPGVSVSIVKNGNITWGNTYGYANLNDSIYVSSNTMFILSSVSKTITATALMQLWENGIFILDDAINDYLPFSVIHPDYPNTNITFKMLLTHTSGIKDRWAVMPYYDGDPGLELGYYLEQYLTPFGEFYNANGNYTNSQPGTNYRYSNIGAGVIGYLVEIISGMPFNEYCNENIFDPIGMDNAAWFLSELDIDQVAIPYELNGGSGNSCDEIGCGIYDSSNPCFCDIECIYYNDCCSDYNKICGENGTGSEADITYIEQNHYGYSDYPSGQLRTSSNDLAKFMAAYINGGEYNGFQLLEEETIELIKTIQYPNVDPEQGLIWYYKTTDERTLFGHNGGDLGSSTEMFISISEDIGVIVLSNSDTYYAVIQIEEALFNFAEETIFQQVGDINQDGTVNIQDIILTINIVLSNGYDYLADINSDNDVNIQDIILLVNMILKY